MEKQTTLLYSPAIQTTRRAKQMAQSASSLKELLHFAVLQTNSSQLYD